MRRASSSGSSRSRRPRREREQARLRGRPTTRVPFPPGGRTRSSPSTRRRPTCVGELGGHGLHVSQLHPRARGRFRPRRRSLLSRIPRTRADWCSCRSCSSRTRWLDHGWHEPGRCNEADDEVIAPGAQTRSLGSSTSCAVSGTRRRVCSSFAPRPAPRGDVQAWSAAARSTPCAVAYVSSVTILEIPFGRTGHMSSRVVKFGAVALSGRSPPSSTPCSSCCSSTASTTSTPPRATGTRRTNCGPGLRSIATRSSSPPRPATARGRGARFDPPLPRPDGRHLGRPDSAAQPRASRRVGAGARLRGRSRPCSRPGTRARSLRRRHGPRPDGGPSASPCARCVPVRRRARAVQPGSAPATRCTGLTSKRSLESARSGTSRCRPSRRSPVGVGNSPSDSGDLVRAPHRPGRDRRRRRVRPRPRERLPSTRLVTGSSFRACSTPPSATRPPDRCPRRAPRTSA